MLNRDAPNSDATPAANPWQNIFGEVMKKKILEAGKPNGE